MTDPDWKPTWQPCRRSTITGHRISRPNFRPVQTRDYPIWPWWPLELLSRVAARKVGQTGKNKLPDRLVYGVELKEGNDG